MLYALPDSLPLAAIDADTTLTRIHRKTTIEPFFGPTPPDPPKGRFDDPLGVFQVCYLGEHETASFVETFLRNPPIRLVAVSELRKRRLTTFRVARALRLLKLHGNGLAQCGCTAAVTGGDEPYDGPRALARAIWEHVDGVDGLEYLCRHDNELKAIALFDRARDALVRLGTEVVEERSRLLGWRKRYGFTIKMD